MNHQLIMENWRKYLNEQPAVMTTGEGDFVADNVDVKFEKYKKSLRSSHRKEIEEMEQLCKSGHKGTCFQLNRLKAAHGNYPKHLLKPTKKEAKVAYGNFREAWNSTAGWILPELPDLNQSAAWIITDLFFGILMSILGLKLLGALFKGAKKTLGFVKNIMLKIFDKAKMSKPVVDLIQKNPAEGIKDHLEKVKDSLNHYFAPSDLKFQGAM